MGKFGNERYGKTLAEKRKTILNMSSEAVQYARTLVEDVEFSAEDAGRTDIGYLAEVVEAAIEAGATRINIPDTTGYTLPREFGEKIAELKKRVKNIDRIILSVHCHNDLGLAVANSIAAIQNGARQVECTMNGIGERAGNASLEEIVMALNVRKDILKFKTDINTREIFNTSRMVSAFTGIMVQPNKAIIGENAFAHEAGIHQDGMLKDRKTYEIMTPEQVGVQKTKLVLGRHSGRHGLKVRLQELGYTITDGDLDKIYRRFTEIADKKKEVYDDDLRTLMGDETFKGETAYQLLHMQAYVGTNSIPTGSIRIQTKGKTVEESATGDGPIDAVFNAIDRALDLKFTIDSYQVRSVTSGRQALGEVMVRIHNKGKSYTGRGVSTDIIEASAKAYLNALNQYENNRIEKKIKPIDKAV